MPKNSTIKKPVVQKQNPANPKPTCNSFSHNPSPKPTNKMAHSLFEETPSITIAPSRTPKVDSIFSLHDLEGRILDTLKAEEFGLSNESVKLAEAIIRAVLAVTDLRRAEEKKIYETENAALKAEIVKLKNERDDDENYSRKNTLVISGSEIPKSSTNEDCYNTVITIINEKTGVGITRSDIDVCHRLPSRKPESDRNPKPIIVKFVRRENKHKILQAARLKKPKNTYSNESLSKTRGKIRYILSKASKEQPGKISSIKTDDCKIKVFTPPLQSGGPYLRTTVNTKDDLDKFLMTKFGFDSTKFVNKEDW